MTPLEYYQQELNANRIQPDAQQKPVVEKLEAIYQSLTKKYHKKNWFNYFRAKKSMRGLYLWGNVGIGKTFLMDCFYHCLTIPKLRLHFHQFMLRIHQELQNIQGKKNPLQKIAKKISQETSVICFDEFFVSNIADAMILGELFLHLFKYGVTLIASSNIPPDLLYKDGLQRERFLPAIELIKKNTEVVHLHSTMDYRQQHIRNTGVYYFPLDATAEHNMQNAFIHFSRGAESFHEPIIICDRPIQIIKQSDSVIWFNFETICGRPRSQNDYLELAKSYRTILVQNLRHIQPDENDLILSFIYLVDILYDAHCKLVLSSSVPISEIYVAGKTKLSFERTRSRLIEMQSEEYVYHDQIPRELTNL